MRSLSVLLTACSVAALLAAGCGGRGTGRSEPRIDHATAEQLAAESDAIAERAGAGDDCGAAQRADELRAHAQTAIDDGRVPSALARELLSSTRALVDELSCSPPPPPPAAEKEHGNKHKHKKKHKEKD